MKKFLTLLLATIMCISLMACENSTADTDYSGTWVREEWTNEKTGDVINKTLHLYEDNTFKLEEYSSIEGYKEYHGEWEIDGDEIKCYPKKIVEGEDPNFDKEGILINGIQVCWKYPIVDKTTLNGGAVNYNKQL